MKTLPWMLAALLVGGAGITESIVAEPATAAAAPALQGKGQGKGKDGAKPAKQGPQKADKARGGQKAGKAQGAAKAQGKGQAKARGRDDAPKARGGNAPGGRGKSRVSRQELRSNIDKLPPNIRSFASDRRESRRFVAGAAARSVLHGAAPAALVVSLLDDGVRVSNRDGRLLFNLDDDRARDLGHWRVVRLDGEPRGNGPAFCRSGEGHPVWGRNWCVEKGFGLGRQDGRIWSRTTDIDDIIFGRRDDRDRLDRGTLVDVLGDIVFNRLALHALSLGFTEPLVGMWIAEPASPRILRIGSGNFAVAELVDIDRNDRVDVLLVALPD